VRARRARSRQGLKPAFLRLVNGPAEAKPFQSGG